MKLCAAFLTLMLIVINISIPSSFKEASLLNTESAMSLQEYVEKELNDFDGEKEEETIETEETEKEFFSTTFSPDIFSSFDILKITYSLKVYISSYIFSFFRPPLF